MIADACAYTRFYRIIIQWNYERSSNLGLDSLVYNQIS